MSAGHTCRSLLFRDTVSFVRRMEVASRPPPRCRKERVRWPSPARQAGAVCVADDRRWRERPL